MKSKLIELQRKLRAINKTIAEIEKKDDKFHIGLSQLRVELEIINNELLRIIVDIDE